MTGPSWSPRGSLVADENEIYDLTNIGTLAAFAIVCVGVLVLRITQPNLARPFRVPFIWAVSPPRRGRLPVYDVGSPGDGMGAIRHLAGGGPAALLPLRLPPEQAPPRSSGAGWSPT